MSKQTVKINQKCVKDAARYGSNQTNCLPQNTG